jgi:transposase
VGVDLGDQWSNYCLLGLEGETQAEGQLRTTREDVAEFFRALAAARVVIEVGQAGVSNADGAGPERPRTLTG